MNNRKWEAIKNEIILKDKRYELFAENIDEIERNQILMGAFEWISAMEYGLDVTEKYKSDVKVIHFDDLKKYNNRFITSILNFLNLMDDDLLHKYAHANLNYKKKQYYHNLPLYFEEYIDRINYRIEKYKHE